LHREVALAALSGPADRPQSIFYGHQNLPAMASVSLFEIETLPVLWVERPDNLLLSTGAKIEPISIAVSATLASLTIITFVIFIVRIRRSRTEPLHHENEANRLTNNVQTSVEDTTASQPADTRAREDKPSDVSSLPMNDMYESSETKTSDSLVELGRRYERQVSEMEAQITFRMSGQTSHHLNRDTAKSTRNALSVSNYSVSEMRTGKERD
jgi:hypothetical protein